MFPNIFFVSMLSQNVHFQFFFEQILCYSFHWALFVIIYSHFYHYDIILFIYFSR